MVLFIFLASIQDDGQSSKVYSLVAAVLSNTQNAKSDDDRLSKMLAILTCGKDAG